jgi:magnesium transporter
MGMGQDDGVITATGYRGPHQKSVHPAGVAEWLTSGGLVWVDLVDATEGELEELEQEFGLHPLAIEDAREQSQRPKLERFPNHAFVVLYGVDREHLGSGPDQVADAARDLPELHVFVGPGWIITLRFRNRAGRALDVTPVAGQYERTRGANCSAGLLLYTILDVVVDSYFDVADRIDEEIEAIEDSIVRELAAGDGQATGAIADVQQQLLDVRRSIIVFRRRVVPLREVLLTLLRREVHWIEQETAVYLEDVLDHLLRVGDQLDSQRELVGNAVDAYLAVVSNRANEIMKKMTSWGAILLGSTLIAGIYGMNFRHMPELGSRLGYPGALLSMALLTAVLYAWFKKRHWL